MASVLTSLLAAYVDTYGQPPAMGSVEDQRSERQAARCLIVGTYMRAYGYTEAEATRRVEDDIRHHLGTEDSAPDVYAYRGDAEKTAQVEEDAAERRDYEAEYAGEDVPAFTPREDYVVISRLTQNPTPDQLNQVMEFDHVVRVHRDGTVTDASGVWAPDLYDGTLDSDAWSLMTGYTGQHGYAGPIMHNSEFIGGRMAEDIMARPGLYVAVESRYSCVKWGEGVGACDLDCYEDHVEGWAVAYIPDPDGYADCRCCGQAIIDRAYCDGCKGPQCRDPHGQRGADHEPLP